MLKTFRNIAAVFVSWYIYVYAGDIVAYGMQPLLDAAVVSVTGDLGMLSVLPYAIAAFVTGMVAAAAVKPRGDAKWAWLFGAPILLSHLVATAISGQNAALTARGYFAAALGLTLLIASVAGAFAFVRKYGSAGRPIRREAPSPMSR